jgi:hypothetical protein
MSVHTSSVQQQAAHVLDMLSRAQAVFGDDHEPADPPEPRTPPHLEDNVGLGYFPGNATSGGWAR